MILEVLESPEALADWLSRLGGLMVFWAKPVSDYRVVSREPVVLEVFWARGREPRRAVVGVALEGSRDSLCSLAGGGAAILVSPARGLSGGYDRRSVVFFYEPGQETLEPNKSVEVAVYERPGPAILGEARSVQKRSWGFYKPPLPGNYVLIARAAGKPVGSAYYNPESGNVDYGVHVAREYWRRRIGTRLLAEVLRLAESRGRNPVSVVRVLRGRQPTSSDKRAIAFYEANKPAARLDVYRLACERQPARSFIG